MACKLVKSDKSESEKFDENNTSEALIGNEFKKNKENDADRGDAPF